MPEVVVTHTGYTALDVALSLVMVTVLAVVAVVAVSALPVRDPTTVAGLKAAPIVVKAVPVVLMFVVPVTVKLLRVPKLVKLEWITEAAKVVPVRESAS